MVAYCSEELDGGQCDGYELAHLAGIMACRVTALGNRCRHCDHILGNRLAVAPAFVPEGSLLFVN